MKQIIKPMAILGIICIVCSGLLGVVESVTESLSEYRLKLLLQQV